MGFDLKCRMAATAVIIWPIQINKASFAEKGEPRKEKSNQRQRIMFAVIARVD
jgi:hypothetical protein